MFATGGPGRARDIVDEEEGVGLAAEELAGCGDGEERAEVTEGFVDFVGDVGARAGDEAAGAWRVVWGGLEDVFEEVREDFVAELWG